VQNKPSLQWEFCKHATHESVDSLQNGVAGFCAAQLTGVPDWHKSFTHVSAPLQ
jgi:hypothetical protein